MDVVRKERNLLLLHEDDKINNEPLPLMAPPSMAPIEPLGLKDLMKMYDAFLSWVKIQSQDLLSNSEFKYSILKEETDVSASRKTLGFETLSPPTKNLILALGDVQLQKRSREEFYINNIFQALSSLSQQIWKSLSAGRSLLQNLIRETSVTRESLHQKMMNEIFLWKEYTQTCNELNEYQSFLGFQHDHGNIKIGDNMESYLHYCEKNKKINLVLHSLMIRDAKAEKADAAINFSSEFGERFKLRMQKNEISKQKMAELSSKNIKTSNLAIALETLRLAENEIDDNILSISNTISSSNANANSNAMNLDEAGTKTSPKEDEENLMKIRLANKKASITLSCVGVKLRLLKKSLEEEIDEDREKNQKQISDSIERDCIIIKGKIFDVVDTIKRKYFGEIEKLERTEKTLKDELQSLLRMVRNDSRGVEQCVRSLSETARKKCDEIQKENFFLHVKFLERLTSSNVP
jgi:hypothetical protein